MPTPRSDEIIAALEETWSATAALCETLTPDAWELDTDCPGWVVRDHVSHMIGTEHGLLGTPAPPPPDPMPGYVRNPIGEGNEAWIAARRDVPGDELAAEFKDVTARRLAQLRSMLPDQWTLPGWSPVGEAPYETFMLIRVMDCWVHGQDIRWRLHRPGDRGGGGERIALDRLSAGVGYVVGRKVAPPAATTVVFEIEGPDPRVLALKMEGTRAVDLDGPPDSPTVGLRLFAEQFVRLACGRQAPDDVLAAGGVAFQGDAALGASIVRAMNFMI